MTLWLAAALAQTPIPDATGRFDVPGATVAAEDGPGTGWVNPANLGYDPDPRFGLYYDRSTEDLGARNQLAMAFGARGQTLSIRMDAADATWWSLDYAGGVKLPGRLALGGALRWRLGAFRNHADVDLSASWRPTRWLGFGAIFTNVADSSDRFDRAITPGMAVHVGRTTLGAEITTGTPVRPAVVGISGRVGIREGAYLRGWSQIPLDGGGFVAGGAIELAFGGIGIGLGGRSTFDDGPAGTAWLGTFDREETLVKRPHVLAGLNLTERPPNESGSGLFSDDEPTWLDTLQSLDRVERDPRYAAALISLSRSMGPARDAELRNRITRLSNAGKPVTVFLIGTPDTGAYWVATAADQIVAHPATVLAPLGIALNFTYVGEAFDQLGLDAQIVRRSTYKTAGETQTRSEPSAEQREQLDAYVDVRFDALVTGIADARGATPEAVRAWMDGGPYTAQQAKEAGLVDGVAWSDDLPKAIEAALDRSTRYVDVAERVTDTDPWGERPGIAVVHVDGVIVGGPSKGPGLLSSRSAGSATIVRQIDRARRDPRVKGLILRVDSPGGSIFASEQILHAVKQVKEADKPVIVSMGDLAASGGYYVSSHADAIYAHPTTLTGSIGVVAQKVSASELFTHVGIRHHPVIRGENAGYELPWTPWTESQLEALDRLIGASYDRFKEHVEEGRKLEADAVEAVAQGRIWAGRDAAQRGLVDQLGGLDDAIADLRNRTGVADDSPIHVFTPGSDLVDSLTGSALPRIEPGVQGLLGTWGVVAAHPDETLWAIEPLLGDPE